MCKYCRIFFRWWIWKDTLRAKLKSCWLDFWGLLKDNEFDVWNNAQLIQLFPYKIFVFWTTQKTLTKCRNLLKCKLFWTLVIALIYTDSKRRQTCQKDNKVKEEINLQENSFELSNFNCFTIEYKYK